MTLKGKQQSPRKERLLLSEVLRSSIVLCQNLGKSRNVSAYLRIAQNDADAIDEVDCELCGMMIVSPVWCVRQLRIQRSTIKISNLKCQKWNKFERK